MRSTGAHKSHRTTRFVGENAVKTIMLELERAWSDYSWKSNSSNIRVFVTSDGAGVRERIQEKVRARFGSRIRVTANDAADTLNHTSTLSGAVDKPIGGGMVDWCKCGPYRRLCCPRSLACAPSVTRACSAGHVRVLGYTRVRSRAGVRKSTSTLS